jgi:small subunit ribosomal protein S18
MEKKDTKETTQNVLEHIDFKDVTRLRGHVNPHARMYNRSRTGFSAREQRDFARATKRARYMALMPYISF